MELPYVEKEVVKESSPVAISLAKHLHSIGAKLYGAFWCSHCGHQKEVIFPSSLVQFELYVVLKNKLIFIVLRSQLKNIKRRRIDG